MAAGGTVGKSSDLSSSETRGNYESFFNSSADLLFVLDLKGNILQTNATVRERLGYTQAELEGRSVLLVHPPERQEEAGRIVVQMLAAEAEFCLVPVQTKAGVQIPVETRVTRGLWNGQEVLFGVTKDISRLVLSEEKFSKIFYLNPSPCGLTDVATGAYVEVNDAFSALFGYAKSEVIGRTAMELGLLSPQTRTAVLAQADATGRFSHVEADLRARDGSVKRVLLWAEPIQVQDRCYRYTVVHDITARTRDEATIRSLLAEKELLLREVHHRIKNQMSTIVGLLTLQAMDLTDSSAVRVLEDASNRVHSMMVLYDRLYQSKGVMSLSTRDYLPQLVSEILANFPNAAAVTAQTQIEDFVLDEKKVQPLGIIINELLANAMKYAFPDRIPGKLTVSLHTDDGRAILTVSDDGIGFPEGVDERHSSGFGMTLLNMLVSQLEGTLEYRCHRGTSAVVSFPL